ncbi:hypothetical protein TRIUR3_05021 [Triticum urartu]|uniref:Uncharacterized protein n=1 Tax=Triticum urartu TaxID=4572 RepID=M8AHB0_TRIUA|nr:hypothetical protein TRIUR3_05021 [Triticum urartu]
MEARMASNNARGNEERATARCSDANLYGGVNVLPGDVYSKETHTDAVNLSVKKGPNKLHPHNDAMARADVIKSGS